MKAPEVTSLTRYVSPDGKLTIEGLKVLKRIVDMLDDHEARITTLEP